jgi:hypothetical protein
MDLPARFWAKVEIGDCWHWVGANNGNGYGRFWWNGRIVYPHRLVYEVLVGVIPAGLYLDHLCRNPGCVNPDHLEPVTARENSLRGAGAASRFFHDACDRGHVYTRENTYITPNGHRRCRGCTNARQNERRKARQT